MNLTGSPAPSTSLASSVRQFLRRRLDDEQIKSLRRFQAFRFRRTQHVLWRLLFGRNLNLLATIYDTDKWNDHWYTQYYQRHFGARRTHRLNVMEIGIGGFDNPKLGGSSLRMWRNYFPNSMIHGIDIYDKRPHDEARIRTHRVLKPTKASWLPFSVESEPWISSLMTAVISTHMCYRAFTICSPSLFLVASTSSKIRKPRIGSDMEAQALISTAKARRWDC